MHDAPPGTAVALATGHRARPLSIRQKRIVAVVMTVASGFVDAVGYLAMYKVFTAHMTGNTVALGVGLVRGNWTRSLQRGLPIPAFLLGLLIGSTALELARRARWRRVLWPVLAAEAACLAAIMLSAALRQESGGVRSMPDFILLATLAAVAMGLQNITVRRVGALSIHTTHVTGTLTRLADELVKAALRCLDKLRGHNTAIKPGPAAMLFSLWTGYLAGALAGAAAQLAWGLASLSLPLALLSSLILLDLLRPVPIRAA